MTRKSPFAFSPDPDDDGAGLSVTRDSATSLAAAAVGKRLEALFSAGGAGFRKLALAHATAVAGDTAVTLALAGTLFFSVPSSEARGNVALYLLLTVAPFAVIGPLLGRLLDRNRGAMRRALIVSSAVRIVLAIVMAVNLEGVLLFPAAFLLLILSRAHGIARNALLPASLSKPIALVEANAKLAQVGVVAGALIAPLAALITKVLGPQFLLMTASVIFVFATITAVSVPHPQDLDDRAEPDIEFGPGRVHLPGRVRISQLATAVVRLLNGFLVLLLAFAFKDADAGGFDFGAVLGAAGLGFGVAAVVAPKWERRLREEPMVVAGLAIEAGAAFAAAQWFGLPAAAALAAAAGFSWGVAKLAFDGLLQSSLPASRRGAAFTRSETVFQLAWVLGALIPVALSIPSDVGLVLAGFTALTAQVVYVSQLLLPGRPGATPRESSRLDAPGVAPGDE
ncbi:MAG: hypothetical protein ACI867_001716 [Glaciecola sp.]|jgi:hypothetical protein